MIKRTQRDVKSSGQVMQGVKIEGWNLKPGLTPLLRLLLLCSTAGSGGVLFCSEILLKGMVR